MENYSQSTEQDVILSFFKSIGITKGNFIDIGANDGKTLSNTYALTLLGWDGVYVEPSKKAFQSIIDMFKEEIGRNIGKRVAFNVAIDNYNGEAIFYESGEHLGKGDTALLSTLNEEELKRWQGSDNKFSKTTCTVWDFATLQKEVDNTEVSSKYDFATIDVEGNELKILPQIDFNALGIRMACIEFNGKDQDMYDAIMLPQGFKLIHKNAENLIYTKS